MRTINLYLLMFALVTGTIGLETVARGGKGRFASQKHRKAERLQLQREAANKRTDKQAFQADKKAALKPNQVASIATAAMNKNKKQ